MDDYRYLTTSFYTDIDDENYTMLITGINYGSNEWISHNINRANDASDMLRAISLGVYDSVETRDSYYAYDVTFSKEVLADLADLADDDDEPTDEPSEPTDDEPTDDDELADDYVDTDTIPVFLDSSWNTYKLLTSLFGSYISNSRLGGILHIIGIRPNFAITPIQAQNFLANYWICLLYTSPSPRD